MKVVAPKGAARRRLGSAFAIQKRLYNSASPRALAGGFAVPSAPSLRFASAHFAEGRVREKPQLTAELCVAPPLARRPLATAFGGDLRSGHTFGLAFGEVSLASRDGFRVS